jgi:acyl-CoA reductase-like NAD-dependent aldehyde dehydrogenase
MRLFKGELFGPSVNLVTVATFDQALACANQSPHAAVAVLLTQDRAQAGRFLRESNAGVCLVNEPGQDWTGNGDAERGTGWEAEYTRWRTVLGDTGEAQAARPGAAAAYEPTRWDML